MTDVKSAWNEAGEKLQGLGASLKQHYAQQRETEPVAPQPVADTTENKDAVGDAFRKVGDALQNAFDALGAAAKDPTVKDEVKQTGKSVADAMSATFAEISDEVKRALEKRKGDGPSAGEPPAAGGTTSAAPQDTTLHEPPASRSSDGI